MNDGDIATIEPAGTNKKVLNTKIDGQNGCPVWSPGGTKIAFVKSYHICVINSDGKDLLSNLTDYLGWDPSWSPDGKRIAYSCSPGQNKFTQIIVMDANGEHKIALTPENPGTVDHSPAWWGSKNRN